MRFLPEMSIADVASMRPLIGVDSLVLGVGRRIDERLVALIAFVRFDAQMDPAMLHQTRVAGKCFRANIASEVPYVGVSTNVRLQISQKSKVFAAFVALELPFRGMDAQHVVAQASCLRERFRTLGTFERTLAYKFLIQIG